LHTAAENCQQVGCSSSSSSSSNGSEEELSFALELATIGAPPHSRTRTHRSPAHKQECEHHTREPLHRQAQQPVHVAVVEEEEADDDDGGWEISTSRGRRRKRRPIHARVPNTPTHTDEGSGHQSGSCCTDSGAQQSSGVVRGAPTLVVSTEGLSTPPTITSLLSDCSSSSSSGGGGGSSDEELRSLVSPRGYPTHQHTRTRSRSAHALVHSSSLPRSSSPGFAPHATTTASSAVNTAAAITTTTTASTRASRSRNRHSRNKSRSPGRSESRSRSSGRRRQHQPSPDVDDLRVLHSSSSSSSWNQLTKSKKGKQNDGPAFRYVTLTPRRRRKSDAGLTSVPSSASAASVSDTRSPLYATCSSSAPSKPLWMRRERGGQPQPQQRARDAEQQEDEEEGGEYTQRDSSAHSNSNSFSAGRTAARRQRSWTHLAPRSRTPTPHVRHSWNHHQLSGDVDERGDATRAGRVAGPLFLANELPHLL
jgi:hypothetical protein